MNKFCVVFLSLFLFLGGCFARHQERESGVRARAIARLYNSSAVLVRAEKHTMPQPQIPTVGDPHIPYCSAVFIEHNFLLTAGHCVDPLPSAIARALVTNPDMQLDPPSPIGTMVKISVPEHYWEGQIREYRIATIIKFDRARDLAVLGINPGQAEFEHTHVQILQRPEELLVGDSVISVSTPLGSLWTVQYGSITQRETRDVTIHENFSRNYLTASNLIAQGSSGSGLVNEDGYLVGICSAFRPRTHSHFFVRPQVILEFLNS